MARFLVLIYGDEQRWAAASQEWNEENGRRHRVFLDAAGPAVLTGGEVVPSVEAVSIRGDDPAGASSPGAFGRTDDGGHGAGNGVKGIGGFYLIEADDLERAVELARAIPEASSPGSGVEVRRMV